MGSNRITSVLCGDLNMLRCFVGTGIPTLLVSADSGDVIFHSRYCHQKRVIADCVTSPGEAVRDLEELGRSFSEKPVLFYGDDAMLMLISSNRERLAKYYRFLMPEHELVEALVDKSQFAQLAEKLELAAPKTITSRQVMSTDDIERYISLPCVLKANPENAWFRSSAIREEGGKPQKALRANNRAELDRLYGRIKQYTDSFVVQEYIEGGDNCIYSFHAYLDRKGEALAHFVGRKIRTYPKDTGLSAYLELVKEPEVVRLGLDILKKLDFVGPVKIDFKKEASTNRFYVLELNARFTLWNYLGAVCGVNLPQAAYKDLTGEPPAVETDYRAGVRWLSFGNDFRAVIRDYHRDGDISWADWLLSYKGEKVYDIFSWRDPYPFVKTVMNYSRALYRRAGKGRVHK